MGQNSSKRNNNNTPRPQSNQQRPQVRKAPPQQRQVKNCVPLGLYPECSWHLNILKKHIGNKNLAPIFKGTDQNLTDLEECPICFLFYPGGLNRSNCCKQPLCTECFLQVKKLPTASVCCPFCNTDNYSVIFVGPKTKEEREIEEKEQQMVLEAEERMRREERERDEERERKKKEAALKEIIDAANKKENNEQEEFFNDDYDEGELLKKFLNEEKSDGEDNNEYLENFYGSGENYDEEYFKNVAKHIESNNQDQLPEDIDDILLMEAIKRSLNTN